MSRSVRRLVELRYWWSCSRCPYRTPQYDDEPAAAADRDGHLVDWCPDRKFTRCPLRPHQLAISSAYLVRWVEV